MWKLIREHLRSEKGAVSTFFAIVFASGILFIAFAITSDASAIYFERRSLQNAADSTSLAIASNCALGSVYCVDGISAKNEAQVIANANSPDGFSTLKIICGSTPLSACTPTPAVECKSVPSNVPNYGRVVLSTQNADGTDKVKSPFFNYLIGNSNSEINVNSCSQTAWGKAAAANFSVPVAMTICSYLTNGYRVIKNYKSEAPACPTIIKDVRGVALSPQPSNIVDGWIIYRRTSEQLKCFPPQPPLIVGLGISSMPPGQETCTDAGGGSNGKTVLASLISANLNKKLFVPVISSTNGTGTGSDRIISGNIVGFYTFIFYGYDFGPKGKDGCGKTYCAEFAAEDTADCGSKRDCIWGKFSIGIVPGVSVSRDTFPSVGAQAVELLP